MQSQFSLDNLFVSAQCPKVNEAVLVATLTSIEHRLQQLRSMWDAIYEHDRRFAALESSLAQFESLQGLQNSKHYVLARRVDGLEYYGRDRLRAGTVELKVCTPKAVQKQTIPEVALIRRQAKGQQPDSGLFLARRDTNNEVRKQALEDKHDMVKLGHDDKEDYLDTGKDNQNKEVQVELGAVINNINAFKQQVVHQCVLSREQFDKFRQMVERHEAVIVGNQREQGQANLQFREQFSSVMRRLQDREKEGADLQAQMRAKGVELEGIKQSQRSLSCKTTEIQNQLATIESIFQGRVRAHSQQLRQALFAELNLLRDRLKALSRSWDLDAVMDKLRRELEERLEGQRKERTLGDQQLRLRFECFFEDEREKQSRALQQGMAELLELLRGKAGREQMEAAKESYYRSLSELIDKQNSKFAGKSETKNAMLFLEHRLEELFEHIFRTREEREAGARLAGLVRCISCAKGLESPKAGRIHEPARTSRILSFKIRKEPAS